MKTLVEDFAVDDATDLKIVGAYPSGEYNEDFEITANAQGINITADAYIDITITWEWMFGALIKLKKEIDINQLL